MDSLTEIEKPNNSTLEHVAICIKTHCRNQFKITANSAQNSILFTYTPKAKPLEGNSGKELQARMIHWGKKEVEVTQNKNGFCVKLNTSSTQPDRPNHSQPNMPLQASPSFAPTDFLFSPISLGDDERPTTPIIQPPDSTINEAQTQKMQTLLVNYLQHLSSTNPTQANTLKDFLALIAMQCSLVINIISDSDKYLPADHLNMYLESVLQPEELAIYIRNTIKENYSKDNITQIFTSLANAIQNTQRCFGIL